MNSHRVLGVEEDSQPCATLFTVARSVSEALVEFRREMPDALVRDLLLGFLGNGHDVVTAVRSTGATIRCIAMTRLPAGTIECHMLAAGFDLLSRKPLRSAQLVECSLAAEKWLGTHNLNEE